MPTGSNIGNTLYWDGSAWVESSNIFNGGTSVGIGTNSPHNNASLELGGVSKGLLINRITTAERNAIPSPIATGLQIFNTTTNCFEFFVGGNWNIIACPFKCGDILVDSRDANSYQTVEIGTQCWMKANLKYLPIVHSNSEFSTQATNSQPGYGVYGYDDNIVSTAKSQANYSTYGVLYNCDAASIACPSGWHLPSDAEWQTFKLYLGMDPGVVNNTGYRGTNQGKQLKSTTLWNPGGTATNLSGFTALPGGYRNTSGTFLDFGNFGFWWSATENGSNAWRRGLKYNNATVSRLMYGKGGGFAVRCLRD